LVVNSALCTRFEEVGFQSESYTPLDPEVDFVKGLDRTHSRYNAARVTRCQDSQGRCLRFPLVFSPVQLRPWRSLCKEGVRILGDRRRLRHSGCWLRFRGLLVREGRYSCGDARSRRTALRAVRVQRELRLLRRLLGRGSSRSVCCQQG
jgi:hypothetical protein